MNRVFIDVREPFEFAGGHVAGAINIPPYRLLTGSKELANIPKDSELIVYCRSGSRSAVAKHILAQQGFTNIVNGINKEQIEAKLKKVN